MAKTDPQPEAAPELVPEKPERVEGDPEDSREGLPPGVRFDTPAGRRAQGMHPDIGNPDEEKRKQEDEGEREREKKE